MNTKEKPIRIELSPEQKKLYEDNFNKEAFDKAKTTIQQFIDNAESFQNLYDSLQNYERDIEYYDEYTIIFCEVELDRSQMATTGDYVGLNFSIYWYEDNGKEYGKIEKILLYSNEPTHEYEAERLCQLDPDSGEVTEWIYGVW